MKLSDFSTMANFTAIDFETANGKMSSICQVGLVRVEAGVITHELDLLVQPPNNDYHWGNSRVHGISRKLTANSPTFAKVWPLMEPYILGQHVVAHNASFDCTCLLHTLQFYGLPQPKFSKHCTVDIYKRNLALLCENFGIELQHHNALSDARACARLFMLYLEGKSPDMIRDMDLKYPKKVSPQY